MNVGVVIIGRNEGDRLTACIQSVSGFQVIYVDSGSDDGSVENAKRLGAEVIELDMSIPFSAARGRNAGYKHLIDIQDNIEYIQFVDGDCEVVNGWIKNGVQFLDENPEYAVVCGRRIEKKPQASIYNSLCEIEWNTPPGDAHACGGDALYNASVLKEVNGFDPGFIAGEEPELCFRIRQVGKKIYRYDTDMTRHDADMHRVSQWWKRSLRSGYAYALNYSKHGRASSEKFKLREIRSIIVWNTLAVILIGLSLVSKSFTPLILFVFLFMAMVFKIYISQKRIQKIYGPRLAFVYALSNMFAKLPQLFGLIKFWQKERSGKRHTLVEYK